MILTRNITNLFNWLLDQLLPPLLRDSRIFMFFPMWMLCRGKAHSFMEFKARAPMLSAEEIAACYTLFADCHLKRSTDLTPALTERVIDDVVGERVLDAGCGRCYLAEQLVRKRGISVTGLDIIVPETHGDAHNPIYCSGNIEALPFADDSFDTVICAHTLEHVTDLKLAISELRRVTRHRLIIVVPRQRPYRYTFDLHLHFFPYAFTLMQIMGNPEAVCEVIGNDIYYLEAKKV